jgi:hypothetical protein
MGAMGKRLARHRSAGRGALDCSRERARSAVERSRWFMAAEVGGDQVSAIIVPHAGYIPSSTSVIAGGPQLRGGSARRSRVM